MLPNKEIRSLTGIRGVAALHVMFYHWVYFLIPNDSVNLVTHYLRIFLLNGNWCVDLFFVLSGFLLSSTSFTSPQDKLNKHSYLQFMFKRFARVYPIYFILTILYFFTARLFANVHPGGLDLIIDLTLFQSILNVDSLIRPAWSLSIEWIIYLVFPLFIVLTNQIKSVFKIILLFAVAIILLAVIADLTLFSYGPVVSDRSIKAGFMVSDFYFGYQSLLRGICCYLLGIIAFTLFKSGKQQRINNVYFYIIYAVQLFCLCTGGNFANILFILLLPFTMLGLTKKSWVSHFFSTGIIYFFGEISFSLYLIHYLLVVNISPRLLNLFAVRHVPHAKYLVFLIIMSGVISLSTFLYFYIERPLNKWLRFRLLKKA